MPQNAGQLCRNILCNTTGMTDMPEYNHEAYSNNVTQILNNGIFHVDIFKIVPLCDSIQSLSGRSAMRGQYNIAHYGCL